jgi:hypothetical protein
MLSERLYSKHFSFWEVCPDVAEIRLFLKAPEIEEDYPVNQAIREILPLLDNNPGIAGGYKLYNTEDVRLDTGSQIRGYMKEASYLALFTCTAGSLFSELTGRYNQERNYLEAFVVDAIGSLTVENAMNTIQTHLEAKMKAEGLNVSNRYSPGYCNWPLIGQTALFGYMHDIPVDVSLTESCLMLPIKSVSGIIGVGKNIRKKAYACKICKNKNCTYRKLIQ